MHFLSPLAGSGSTVNGSNGDDRPSLRSLETQSTIPLGHVDPVEADVAVDGKYNQALWKCLFEDIPDKEVAVDQLLIPTAHWLDTRLDNGDIDSIDPFMKEACEKAVKLRSIAEQKEQIMQEKNKARSTELSKIAVAADAMIDLQLKKVKDFGGTSPEESPLFKVNKENILVWKSNKTQLVEKAYQCVVDDWKRSEHDCTDQIRAMVELAFSVWEKRNFSEPSPGVDPELFGELEAILESQSTHPVTW